MLVVIVGSSFWGPPWENGQFDEKTTKWVPEPNCVAFLKPTGAPDPALPPAPPTSCLLNVHRFGKHFPIDLGMILALKLRLSRLVQPNKTCDIICIYINEPTHIQTSVFWHGSAARSGSLKDSTPDRPASLELVVRTSGRWCLNTRNIIFDQPEHNDRTHILVQIQSSDRNTAAHRLLLLGMCCWR